MRHLLPTWKTHGMLFLAGVLMTIGGSALAGQIDPVLGEKLRSTPPMENVRVIVYLNDQVDLQAVETSLQVQVGAGARIPVELRYRTILDALQTVAARTQPVFMQEIARYEAAGALTVHDQFWIRNIVVLSTTPALVEEIALLPDVSTVYLDGIMMRDLPLSVSDGPTSTESSEPGLRAIRADKLWELGYNGTGRLVMNIDTGVNGNNLSYAARWRGAQPGIQPAWAWFDPSGGTTFPVDGDGHGSHTMGTMCGLYTASNETLGVAPGAHWIASNSLMGGSPHTSRSIASFQWAANPDGDPSTLTDVPDAISNSWYDPNVSSTQCNPDAGGYAPVIQAVEALGSAVVFSAGNNGPSGSSLTPPKNRLATAVDVFSVGAVDGNTPGYPIASFSSRGPSTCTGPDSLRIKPEVSAPGVNVRSAANSTTGTAVMSGTSMASPHVAGAIALLRQVAPFLTGTEIKYILMNTAADLGPAGEDNDYGHGIIDLWAAYLALPLDMGYVKGQVTSGGNPLSGVKVDFVDSVLQLSGTSDGSGNYKASARIDTPFTTATYTLRAQKFGYLTFTDTLTIVLHDTVTRNVSLSPAPGGTLEVHAYRNDLSGIRSNVRVVFGGQTVVDDSTDGTTGLFSTPLPSGSYTVVVDPPSPYATRTFDPVTITAGTTTNVDALVRFVLEPSPIAVRDTLVVGQVRAQTLTLSNTTTDPVQFRITDDNALKLAPRIKGAPVKTYEGYTLAKDAPDPHQGIGGTEGRGGPDAFGYQWVDSDEPDGPVFNWVDITGVGTPITTWTGSGDDGHAIVPMGFSFPYYGVSYNQVKITTNGWISFDVVSTNHTFSNTAIPAAAEPNTGVYMWWDDLNVSTSGTIHYYDDVANSRFIVQYTNVPHYGTTTPGLYTFQVILYPNGNMLYQYLDMQQTLNSATIGIENETGLDGLQVVYNNTYVHNNLAIAFRLPDAPWISENPVVGTIPAGGSQPITVTFDATGLTVGTDYNANIFVDANHPDVDMPFAVPAQLSVEFADSAVLILSPASLTYGETQINTTVRDTITARNGGLLTLNATSIASTNSVFAVSPSTLNLAPGDSAWIVVAYTPTTVGTDTGRIVILSNSQGSPRIDAPLTGTAIGAPAITVVPGTLRDTLQVGDVSVLSFDIANLTPPPTVPLMVTLSESATWLDVTPTADTLAGSASATFTAAFNASGLSLGEHTADITIASNDPATPSSVVACTLLVMQGPVIGIAPDSLVVTLDPNVVVSDTLVIKNTGPMTLNWTLGELPAAMAPIVVRTPAPPAVEMPKDVEHPGSSGPITDGQGGPDGFGYRWIDSDEPGGPVFNWVDITGVGTPITTWTGSGDDGHAIVPLPFPFTWYGTAWNSVKITTNGWISFDIVSTNHTFSNTAIPAAAEPNNTVYMWWDDLDVRTSGTIHYYDDTANNRFIVQYTDVPHYGTTTPGVYTFQVILTPAGTALVQYLDMQQTLNSATIGIESPDGSTGLQVVYNNTYMHNNLAILYSRGIAWLSEDPTSGSVNPGDSAKVAVTFNTTGLVDGDYHGVLQFASNDLQHNPKNVPVHLTVASANPSVTVTSPNGGEQWTIGQNYQIMWTKNLVDTVTIDYSTNGGSSWIVISTGTPARITVGEKVMRLGAYLWTIPNTPSSNCLVRVADKANPVVFDVSNAPFTITTASAPLAERFADHVTSTFRASVTNEGNIGSLNAFVGTGPGSGFRFNPATTTGQRLFEGAIMIGLDSIHVSSAARDSDEVFDGDFKYLANMDSSQSSGIRKVFTTSYTDSLAENPFGVRVNQRTVSYDTAGLNKFLIFELDLVNTTASPYSGLMVGGFFDWDVASTANDRGSVVVDSTNAIPGVNGGNPFPIEVIELHPGSAPTAWVGIVPVSANIFAGRRVGIQSAEVYPPHMTKADKWRYMTENRAGNPNGDNGTAVDHSQFFGMGPYAVSAGATRRVGFALVAGTSFADIIASARAAQAAWVQRLGNTLQVVGTDVQPDPVAGIPGSYALEQNFPNPFNPATVVRFDLPEQSEVSLRVYDILGREVAVLAEGVHPAGRYSTRWNGTTAAGTQVASGVYIYRLEAVSASGETFSSLRKMVFMK